MTKRKNGNYEKFVDDIFEVYDKHILTGKLTHEQVIGAMYSAMYIAQKYLEAKMNSTGGTHE